ncbi:MULTISPECIES: hypothetical protein [Rhodococcus]|uniref:hypothetical protein n=1 Tax=Rhodococcus TaxID=1827 RepID=UPI0007AE4424|nr:MULTISPECIES: hypothetical protein [Rhodococcus]KZL30481.1 hypothetical protein A3852_23120 [Rhodococcus qingshengii]MCE4165053.1 hypothetical protein [Rhodococcus sp. Ni2]
MNVDTPDLLPSRVVDHDNRGWFLTLDADNRDVYAERPAGAAQVYVDLVAAHGPLRPVVALTSTDADALRGLFARAGRKTVATLAAALELVHYRLRESRGGLERWAESSAYANTTLIAGRPGSWESELIYPIVLFGNSLNLADKPAGDPTRQRAEGPHRRVDAQVRDDIAVIIERWVTDPAGYTEVAENLAALVAGFADKEYGADGWKKVADQWLDPRAALHNAETDVLYRLFYSRSEYGGAF